VQTALACRSLIQNYSDPLLNSRWLPWIFGLYFLVTLSAAPLFDLDEGAFSSATMEMLKRGDFLTTYMGGELRFDKPILIYWLQAASVQLLGLNEFALRLPSALCASAWMLSIFYFLKQFFDISRANTAVILMATSLLVSIIGRAATADALLNVLICLSLLDAFRFFTEVSENTLNPQYIHCSKNFRFLDVRIYAWVGLGVLAKGPVAIVIPLLSMSLFAFFSRNWRAWRLLIINPLGWLVCGSLFLPWYLAEYAVQGQAFLDGFFFKHNLSRFTSTLEGHGGHWYYYLPVSLLVFMPATGFWLMLIGRTPKLFKSPFDIWCCCWFAVVLVLFSFSKTQLPHYLLYGATPIFMLMAKHREQLSQRWLMVLPVVFILSMFFLLPEAAKYLIDTGNNSKLIANLRDGLDVFDWAFRAEIVLAISAITFVGLWLPAPLWQRQLLVSVIFTAVFISKIMPAAAAIQQQPLALAVQFARSLSEPIVMDHQDMPSFSVYLNRVIPIRKPQPGEVVFTAINQMQHYPNATVLFTRGAIVLANQILNIRHHPWGSTNENSKNDYFSSGILKCDFSVPVISALLRHQYSAI
jgi:4-amino-4-deoxy-L-arabinose transferase-like glycosyltransferase